MHMRKRHFTSSAFLSATLLLGAYIPCDAAEYGFSSYGLGGAAFGAGATPPPGTYVTSIMGFYTGDINASVNFGGVIINAGAKVDYFTSGTNILYVPERKLFGGNLGLSVTIPTGHVDVEATVGGPLVTVSREVDGWGLGDIVSKAQLGWQHGEFSHTIYVQAVAPTGRWERGFSPIIGLHRPGVDTGWAVTWTDKATKVQVNGAAGFTFNFENTETDYKTGNEFHFEWAIGRECAPGLVLGLVGYDYRQLTGDSGAGATLGSFKGNVDAVGAGLSYTTLIGQTPLVLNLRHYREFNVDNRFEGNSTLASATVRW
jgi:hypothetical protein